MGPEEFNEMTIRDFADRCTADPELYSAAVGAVAGAFVRDRNAWLKRWDQTTDLAPGDVVERFSAYVLMRPHGGPFDQHASNGTFMAGVFGNLALDWAFGKLK